MKKQILKSLLTFGVIAFAAISLATSCEKFDVKYLPPERISHDGNNSGIDKKDVYTCEGLCPNVGELKFDVDGSISKVRTETVTSLIDGKKIRLRIPVVYLNAAELAKFPLRSRKKIFAIQYLSSDSSPSGYHSYGGLEESSALLFVNRIHVTKDTIDLAISGYCPRETESAENGFATNKAGGNCRTYTHPLSITDPRRDNDRQLHIYSHLGTVFDNTKTTTHARGNVRCYGDLYTKDGVAIDDTSLFRDDYSYSTTCSLAVINDSRDNTVVIDDAWVGDAASVTEMDFHVIGIDVSNKIIPKWSDAPGFNKAVFDKYMDNAAFKKLLRKYKWMETNFRVKIVTAAQFNALPK